MLFLPSRRPFRWMLASLCAVAALAAAPPPEYSTTAASPDGIGRVYMGREIAQVMGYPGADWLERGSREREERPDLLLAALALAPGMMVADVGAGTGYYSWQIAGRIGPQGRVYAVDVQPQMLDLLKENMRRRGVRNVQPVLGKAADSGLAPASIDQTGPAGPVATVPIALGSMVSGPAGPAATGLIVLDSMDCGPDAPAAPVGLAPARRPGPTAIVQTDLASMVPVRDAPAVPAATAPDAPMGLV